MKKFIALGAGAVGATGISMALFGAGIANADDYAGMSYDDASSAASDAGQSVTIASRLGSLPDSDCVVERSQSGSFIDGADFTSKRSGEIEFYLNCNGAVAKPGKPGNSAASAAGRAELAKEAEEAAQQQQDQSAELLQAGDEPAAPTLDVPTG